MTTSAQPNENHEQVNQLSDEHSVRTKAVIDGLKQQRDQANNALVVLSGDKAVLEQRLAKMTASYQQTFQQLDKVNSDLMTTEGKLRLAGMANANLDSQVKNQKEAIESFYASVKNLKSIDELRKLLCIDEDESEVQEGENAENAEPPKTIVERFLSAFGFGSKN